jgi:ribokinase
MSTSPAPPPMLVTVVGSVNQDILVRCPTLPGRGETVGNASVTYAWGGKGANQVVAAAVVAPSRVSFVGAVGADPLGDEAIADLVASGVATELVQRLANEATGQAFVMIGDDGENQIVVCPGANAALDHRHIPPRFDATVVMLSGEVGDDALDAAARASYASSARLLYNVAPPRPVSEAIQAADPLLIVNEHEAEAITGIADPAEATRVLQSLTGSPVVTTIGAAGVLFTEGTTMWHQRSAQVTVVDTTGAGDAFCGAFAARLAQGGDLADAVRFGVAAGALCCTRIGARLSWAAMNELLPFIDGLEPPSAHR